MKDKQELQLVEDQPTQIVEARKYDATPGGLLEMAFARGAPLEQIEKYMQLKRDWDADAARKAHFKAMAEFRKTQIIVMRSETIKDGPLKGKKHAKLFDFVDAATPALSSAGLSVTWRILSDDKDWIHMACIVSHEDGHQEQVAMGGPPDTGPGRNAIQARNSTVTYLEKATFKMALGLAERGDDDDGNGGPRNQVTETLLDANQVTEIKSRIKEYGLTESKFLNWAKVSKVEEILAKNYEACLQCIEVTKQQKEGKK